MRAVVFALLTSLLVPVSLVAQEARGRRQADRPAPDREIVYKKIGDVELKLHVFEPQGEATEPRPAVVFFFGGGWRSGTPSQFYPQAKHLAEKGIFAACAEYRIKNTHNTTPAECVADGKSAVRYLRQHAKELKIDPNRIAAGGGSAGGHVAATTGTVPGFEGGEWSSADENLEVSSKPNALILFNPALNTAALGQRIPALADLGQKISPTHHVGAGVPPTIIFHGKNDTTVSYESAEAFCNAMKEAGNRCELKGYDGAGHGFFNFGRGDAYPKTVEQMDEFLTSLGWLKN